MPADALVCCRRMKHMGMGTAIGIRRSAWAAAACAALAVRFARDMPWGRALYFGAFHAVSAFNNAGFALFSNNLVNYRGDLTINAVITGLIIAATLMHPDKKLKSIDLDFVKRRYKEKSFAKGARREEIEESRHLGLDLDEFLSIAIKAMQGIDGDLGL